VVDEAARRAIGERLCAAGVADDTRLVAFQLGASRPIRRWPLESFAALADELGRDGSRVVVVGGGGERELAQGLLQTCAPASAPLDLCGQTSIQELAALLERCALLVTGDTGPMHVAAATRTPIAGLFFGPALPFDTGPYGADHVLLHAAVGCAPCDHAVQCLAPFCRTTITPDLVASVVRARLAGDWPALDALAAQAPPLVGLYRTGFDEHGLFACNGLGARPWRTEDELRWAYRATWLALLEGRRLPAARRGGIDLAPFATLGELARRGADVAVRLAARASSGLRTLDEVRRLGKEIETLDRAIGEHGRVHPDVAVLAQMFAFEKETMPGGEVAALAYASARLYRELARSADCMTGLLGGGREAGEVEHASVRQ
jgi:hypothetical protein